MRHIYPTFLVGLSLVAGCGEASVEPTVTPGPAIVEGYLVREELEAGEGRLQVISHIQAAMRVRIDGQYLVRGTGDATTYVVLAPDKGVETAMAPGAHIVELVDDLTGEAWLETEEVSVTAAPPIDPLDPHRGVAPLTTWVSAWGQPGATDYLAVNSQEHDDDARTLEIQVANIADEAIVIERCSTRALSTPTDVEYTCTGEPITVPPGGRVSAVVDKTFELADDKSNLLEIEKLFVRFVSEEPESKIMGIYLAPEFAGEAAGAVFYGRKEYLHDRGFYSAPMKNGSWESGVGSVPVDPL